MTQQGGEIQEGIFGHKSRGTVKNQDVKNVLQFLLISAHGRIPCNLVSKYWVHLAVHQGEGGM